MFGNSLEEKSRYIFYRSGPMGSDNSECGSIQRKVLKKKVKWEQSGTCTDGKQIWKIEFL